MKIICIGRNYVEHIKELGNEIPDDPVVFTKPDTALLVKNKSFYYPSGISNEVHHELEIVIRISTEGTNIEEKFASKYYDKIGLGIDFTARDIQDKSRAKGLPWALSKGFNGSAPVSDFVPVERYEDIQNINFSLKINGKEVQKGNTGLMIYKFNYLVAYVSKFMFLKKGDLIFTGTPKGVGPVNIGDAIEGYIENQKFLDFEIK